ncbi:MAG: GldM family protein [Flavobacteriales bacterium]|nr:GldM family protein [Flavobacteriales bacterium]
MASGRMTPRQKMINMMYLVLTALLALNVSKEVLNSFFEVNLGIVKTTNGLDKKNTETYAGFEEATNQKKVKNYKNLANKIKPDALELVDFIQEMKYTLVLAVDNAVFLGEHLDEDGEEIEDNKFEVSYDKLDDIDKNKTIAFLSKKDDRNSSGDVFNPESKAQLPRIDGEGKATQLKNYILDYKELLLDVLETSKDSNWVTNNGKLSSLIQEINTTLDIKEGKVYGDKGKKVSWEHYNFYDMPSVGALTLLSKWQADVKNMELAVISFLASNVNESFLKFSGAEATTIPSSNFILRNEEFKSKIFLTAFDKSSTPEIFIGNYEVDENGDPILGKNGPIWTKGPEIVAVENGKGIYSVKGNRVGPQTYKGLIKILQDDGDQYYPFEGEYLVADKSFAVSATQMNVLYANDIENPIQVSVAGYQPEDIKVSFGGGSLTSVNRKKGEYIIKPSQANVGKEVNVSLSVKQKDQNRYKPIGKSVFRVKNVPGQTIGARYADGTHDKNKIIANTFSSKIKDFDFPIKFSVSEFTVVCIGTKRVETKVKGYKVSEAAKLEINKLAKGQTVLFKDFVVRQKGVPTYLDRPKDKFELIIE